MAVYLLIHRDEEQNQTFTDMVIARHSEEAILFGHHMRGRYANFVACYSEDGMADLQRMFHHTPPVEILRNQQKMIKEEEDLE